ncbi:MAG TPA: DUF2793 domain-containing protein [Xanthobacteraceae bacterium]|nr:DUF2793 domain-containing protein [Xanthobacteraceae bacterium]
MTDTPNLGLPYIEAAQAQKHVTHNEALRVLDRLLHLAVLDRDLSAPPASPAEGQRWIVAAAPTGDWAGHATHVAAWQDGTWEFSAPNIGWLAYVIDEGALLTWDGSAWVDALTALSAWQNVTLLGIGTTADATNPFSAKLNNALWTARTAADGGDGDLRYKLTKESAANTLSFLFQDNFSGRAEIGLTGDDDFHFKVSPDGTSWLDAILIDKDTGAVTLPNTSGSSGGDMLKSTYDANADGKIDPAAGGTGVGSASANQVFAGPASGAAAAPGFRALTASDLPDPTATTKGGVKSLASVAHKWLNAIGTDGLPSATQPAFSDISGSVGAAQMPALTGDVTTSAGSVATSIASGVVTFAKLASAAIATAAQYLANTANLLLTTDKVWSAAATVALTDGATITPDFSAGINFTVTLGGNRTLANPTNQKVGQSGFIRIAQDATGSRTLSFGTNWKFAGGNAPVLTTAASKVDVLAYVVTGSGEIMASLTKAIV